MTWAKAHRPGYPDKPQLMERSEGFVAVETSAKDALRILCAACRVSVVTR